MGLGASFSKLFCNNIDNLTCNFSKAVAGFSINEQGYKGFTLKLFEIWLLSFSKAWLKIGPFGDLKL